MATVLKSDKDAGRYFSKLLAKHPDGVLVIGPAGAGKTTLLHALKKVTSFRIYFGDDFGSMVKVDGQEQWHIKWADIPEDFQIVDGVPDNIEDLFEEWHTDKMAICLMDVAPERWLRTMSKRGNRETHYWAAKFKEMGTWSPSKASKHLGELIVTFRKRCVQMGDRIYTIRTSDWPGYENETGRMSTKGEKEDAPGSKERSA